MCLLGLGVAVGVNVSESSADGSGMPVRAYTALLAPAYQPGRASSEMPTPKLVGTDHAAAIILATVAACQVDPPGVTMPASLMALAMARSDALGIVSAMARASA